MPKRNNHLVTRPQTLAGAMVHSLNNHLAVVLGNLEMVMEDTRFNEDASESINEAVQAARELEKLSSKILLFLGQPVGKLEPTDLARFCLQHVEKIDCITPKNIILETKLPCSITPIKMDKMLMEQALNNLIENALEAIGNKEGVITLSVTVVSIFNIGEMSCFPEDWEPDHSCYACLEVCDNGCGVEPGDIKKIFEPFFTRKFIGRGLGLSAVLGIVVAHDGAVCVKSNPQQGTVFRLLLPLIAITTAQFKVDRPAKSVYASK